MRILFVGDVVGRSGRTIVIERLPGLIAEWKLDLVVVNGENSAGGFGITEVISNELFEAGADALTLNPGDRVLWYWATFGPTGGPPTLVLQRTKGSCYRVLAQDDAGKTRPARGALLHLDRRTVPAPSGSACVGPHGGLVRATLKGAVRSNALR